MKPPASYKGILATALNQLLKELAYKALVRPHLECTSPVWDTSMDLTIIRRRRS